MVIFHPISSKIGSKEARHNGDRKALLDCHVFCEIKNGPNFVAINLAKKWHGCYCLQLGCLYSLLHSAVDNLAFLTKVRLLKWSKRVNFRGHFWWILVDIFGEFSWTLFLIVNIIITILSSNNLTQTQPKPKTNLTLTLT